VSPPSISSGSSGRPGYRFPAEWEKHEATWIGWPHNTDDWPGKFAPIPWVYGEIVRNLARGEAVRVLVSSAAHEHRARLVLTRSGADLTRVEFFRVPTDRGWTRDFGPVFVRPGVRHGPRRGLQRAPGAAGNAAGRLAIAGFRFNGWAKYRDHRLDARVARQLARRLGIPFVPVEVNGHDFVLEGGAIDANGCGTIVSTEECLLDPHVQTRNPGLGRGEIERIFADYLGARNAIWLGRGIAGDDTHGHVDDLCRFVGPRTLALCRERNERDANYGPLEENWERMQDARLEDGSKPEVVPLPMPAPLYFEGRRLPASYANFYICNAGVLVPTFNDPSDRIALGVLAELVPDRPVIGIHSVDLVWGLGTLHCLTQQQPAPA
jgi:agmatine deiminase